MRSPNAGSADAAASSWTAPLSGTQNHLRRILREYATHHNQHRPHRLLHGATPQQPLPEPVNLDQYRVRKHAHVGGLFNEYRLVA